MYNGNPQSTFWAGLQIEIIGERVKYMDQDRIKVKIKWRLIRDLQHRQICQLDITCTVMC